MVVDLSALPTPTPQSRLRAMARGRQSPKPLPGAHTALYIGRIGAWNRFDWAAGLWRHHWTGHLPQQCNCSCGPWRGCGQYPAIHCQGGPLSSWRVPHTSVVVKREAQVPKSLLSGFVATPYFSFYGQHLAPVEAPFTANTSGAPVPQEPNEVLMWLRLASTSRVLSGRQINENLWHVVSFPVNLMRPSTQVDHYKRLD